MAHCGLGKMTSRLAAHTAVARVIWSPNKMMIPPTIMPLCFKKLNAWPPLLSLFFRYQHSTLVKIIKYPKGLWKSRILMVRVIGDTI